MKTIVSTAGVHRRDAFDYWHEMLCKRVVPHDCAPQDRWAFSAEEFSPQNLLTLLSFNTRARRCKTMLPCAISGMLTPTRS